MTSTEVVNSIFSDLLPQVDSFISGDLLTVITGMIAIIFIVFAGTKIFELLNMTVFEKDAKNTFRDYKRDRGTWREAISRRKYKESLFRYEADEFERGNK